MHDQKPVLLSFPENESDEIGDILDALRDMARRASSPVVQVCLEDVQEEIAHLTNRDELMEKGKIVKEAV